MLQIETPPNTCAYPKEKIHYNEMDDIDINIDMNMNMWDIARNVIGPISFLFIPLPE
jgi:hypothetical protein